MREANLAKAFDDVWAKSSTRNWIVGRLGVFDGTPEGIDVVGRPGYVYVTMGVNADQGVTIVKDKVGVAKVVFQEVKMRRELGELVIREASAYASGNGGSGGGSDTLAGLDDVLFTGLVSGHSIQFNGTKWINVVPSGGSGGAPSPHSINSTVHHTLPAEKLFWSNISFTGSNLADLVTRNHDSLNGINPNQHHLQIHPLVGPDSLSITNHTAEGLQVGFVVRGNSPTEFSWGRLLHDEIDPLSIRPDQHHPQQHDIVGADHTIQGEAFSVVGAIFDDTLGLIIPSSSPGTEERLLKTDEYGGLQLKEDLLYVDGFHSQVGINIPPVGAALDIRSSHPSQITQRIRQVYEQSERMWRVENYLGEELIVLDGVGNLQSGRPSFVSGRAGWRMTPGGNLEANNIWARGELHASVFVKDEVHATGGTLAITSAGKLYEDAIIDSSTSDEENLEVDSNATAFPGDHVLLPITIETTSSSFIGTTLSVHGIANEIKVENPPSGEGLYFEPGEILRVKTEVDKNNLDSSLRVADLWLEVMEGHQDDGFSRYSVIKHSGSDFTIPKGTAIVSWKKRGEGLMMMTSDWGDNEGYTPYLDVLTNGANPWDSEDPTAQITHVRLGQLSGIGILDGSRQWGMIAGSNLNDANSGYLLASNRGLLLHKVNIRVNDGDYDTGHWFSNGTLKLSKDVNTTTPLFSGFMFDVDSGDIWIGEKGSGADNYLHWSQSSGTLTVVGALSVGGGGEGFVTQGQLDTAISDAKTYSSDFTNFRRIYRVTGAWRSTAYNNIQWGSIAGGANISLYFHNGQIRTVTAGQISITKRAYFYVNIGESGIPPSPLAFVTSYHDDAPQNDPNLVLIAVIDPGPSSPAGHKASVNVVAGGVYISGGNIFAGSIHAANIAVGTITANEISGTTITTAKMAPSFYADNNTNHVTPIANNKRDEAIDYSEQRRIFSVTGSVTISPIVNSGRIDWGNLTVRFADGSANQTIAAGGVVLSQNTGPYYFFVNLNNTGTLTLEVTNNFNAILSTDAVIAVAEPFAFTTFSPPGSGYPTFRIIAGATYISGDRIITDSIIARNIKAGAIETEHMTAGTIHGSIITGGTLNADAIIADSLDVITANTGNLSVTGVLTMGQTGRINTVGRTTATSATPGFFLGHEAGVYRFSVGNAANYVYWDGADLYIRSRQAVILTAAADDRILRFYDKSESALGDITFTWDGARAVLNIPLITHLNQALEAPNLLVFDTFASTTKEVIAFQFGAVRKAFSFTGSGSSLLIYDGDFSVGGTVFASTLVNQGNTFRLVTPRPPPTPGSGAIGEMCWSWDGVNAYLYVCVAAGNWRRTPLINF